MPVSYQEREAAVKAAVARYPNEFALRDQPRHRFKVVGSASYWSESAGGPLLYTYRWDEGEGRWLAYAKGTEAELLREMRPITPEVPAHTTP